MSKPMYLFAGPSLYGTRFEELQYRKDETVAPDGIFWRPPARRGDIATLIESTEQPAAIGLADGTFHSYPSVGHRELRDAIDAGWNVYGLCSMGAIRVAELFRHGMIPWGKVAQHYLAEPSTGDDEVALVHGTESPFYPLSEPLVHLRAFLRHCSEQQLITPAEEQLIAKSLKERWYARRTHQEFTAAVDAFVALDRREMMHQEFATLPRFKLKQQDLESFLTARPWRHAPATT